jgi:hypothetical protein
MPRVGSEPMNPVFEQAMTFPRNACAQFALSISWFAKTAQFMNKSGT